MARHKCPRGGQPGNQNARKHGFYAVNMSPEEVSEYWDTISNKHLSPEVVSLNMKLKTAFRNPSSPRVLRDAIRLVVNWHASHEGYRGEDYLIFRKAVRAFLKAAATGDPELTQRIVSRIMKTLPD